ncbi:MAG TPA: nitrilase family protein [Chitinophagaceae bacterium]|nr:nitrilase family protein [Chitinophagaceae bacterium]
MNDLHITLVQSDLHWEDPEANLAMFGEKLSRLPEQTDLVVLPEMFPTGFSLHPQKLAQAMDGPVVRWMQEKARGLGAVITGSLIIREEGRYYNRLIWAVPDGTLGTYDKRHLFSPGREDGEFTRGNKRLIARLRGWKICLNICYDLRFPAWTSNQAGSEFDLLLYAASWPGKRNLAWNTLLQARAIENQCFVAGVNRVGTDPSGEVYDGDSSLIGPTGEILRRVSGKEAVIPCTLSWKELASLRESFPFLRDGDQVMLA